MQDFRHDERLLKMGGQSSKLCFIEGLMDSAASISERMTRILGYLNFSTGSDDPRFAGDLDRLYREAYSRKSSADAAWAEVRSELQANLTRLRESQPTFANTNQANRVIGLTWDGLLPAYREFHKNLLFHQSTELLFTPFFVARAIESVLQHGTDADNVSDTIQKCIFSLNDFVGHRPVAILHSRQRMEPYPREKICPVPLYLRDAGACLSPHETLTARAIEILKSTDEEILRLAHFYPDHLDELAVDPRAYDFEHPAHKRPNYVFGEWDPHQINNRGFFRRFVVRQVTLDALAARIKSEKASRRETRTTEAAIVLAGTILMASGISGYGPGAHDSTVTLASLMPRVAYFRDQFYEHWVNKIGGIHGELLAKEARRLRQPFGWFRQHLNGEIARLRSTQTANSMVSLLFAGMGQREDALTQARMAGSVAAQFAVKIHCALVQALRDARGKRIEAAAGQLKAAEEALYAAIEGGALIDPWNVLGFQCQFPLFAAMENAVPDERVDRLVELVVSIFDTHAAVRSEAAAAGETANAAELERRCASFARWWDEFATTEVADAASVSGSLSCQSATDVAAAVAAWQNAGQSAGDIAFWRPHVELFTAPKSYARVLDILLDRRDHAAAMAVAIHWVSRSDEIPLEEPDCSFCAIALKWLHQVLQLANNDEPARPASSPNPESWELIVRFLDLLEANAEHFWSAPEIQLGEDEGIDFDVSELLEGEEEDDLATEEETYSAAYEGVTFRDSAFDGTEGSLFDEVPADESEFEQELLYHTGHLLFLCTVAQIWSRLGLFLASRTDDGSLRQSSADHLEGWLKQARRLNEQLCDCLGQIARNRLSSLSSLVSPIELDRARVARDMLFERVMYTCLELRQAEFALALAGGSSPEPDEGNASVAGFAALCKPLLQNDLTKCRHEWPRFRTELAKLPLLYPGNIRLASPSQLVEIRFRHRLLRLAASGLPRVGMLRETCELLETALAMEHNHAPKLGSVTEFDLLYERACRGIFEAVTRTYHAVIPNEDSEEITAALEKWSDVLLALWLRHSRTLRLSSLESASDGKGWDETEDFIKKYGHDLFDQNFLQLANLRAIRHHGVDDWLDALCRDDDAEQFALVAALDRDISRQSACRQLEVIIDTVAEKYDYYRDYNSTTTQSDQGEMLFSLLDFLRLVASYDRIAWNLRPVRIAHSVLVDAGQDEAAAQWRRAVLERTSDAANSHLLKYEQLCRKYGMRLRSVQARLAERFLHPFVVDCLLRSLRQCLREENGTPSSESFARLKAEIGDLLQEPASEYSEVPDWIESLLREFEDFGGAPELQEALPVAAFFSAKTVTRDELERQLNDLLTDDRRGR